MNRFDQASIRYYILHTTTFIIAFSASVQERMITNAIR